MDPQLSLHGIFDPLFLFDLCVDEKCEFKGSGINESWTFVTCEKGGLVRHLNSGWSGHTKYFDSHSKTKKYQILNTLDGITSIHMRSTIHQVNNSLPVGLESLSRFNTFVRL